jgi:hypothetical protein
MIGVYPVGKPALDGFPIKHNAFLFVVEFVFGGVIAH